MGREWTKEQQMVLEERGNDLLVSAAAGSGKTAVMVERIIRLITEGENPPDIDRFLVVTFTRAAAASMRERIARAISEALEQDPGNVHLQKQSALLHQAQITTIHSFCQEVVRSHFYELDIDPGFRVADEGEMTLLKREVLDELMEEAHLLAQEDDLIRAFFDRFASGTSDEEAAAQILHLYEYSCAYPWPAVFRSSLTDLYGADDVEALDGAAWMDALRDEMRRMIGETVTELGELAAVCRVPGGPEVYTPALESDLERFAAVLRALEKADAGIGADEKETGRISYDQLRLLIDKAQGWGRLAACKGEVDEQRKEMVQESRKQLKKDWENVQKKMFSYDASQILEMNRRIRPSLQGLISLTDRFEERFLKAKADRGCVDFSDLEHFALRILMNQDGSRANAGEEYAARFMYVMTDEYQDSNLVQETILRAVSGNGCGAANRFMVGDVKQSIYRFRQARPDLFIEKYRSYKKVREDAGFRQIEGESHVIELHRNFRSRPQILESVNRIFEQIMGADVGDVAYDEDAMLRPGAVFPDLEDEQMPVPELYLIDTETEDDADEDDAMEAWPEEDDSAAESSKNFDTLWERADNCEREAFMVAERIRGLVGSYPVCDGENGGYRKAGYGDIAVLYRGGARYVTALEHAFTQFGIPFFSGAGGGYFNTIEVQTILSYLRVIDNPKQDIPLLGVLRSPIGGYTDEELARLRAACPDTDLYRALCADARNPKTERFLARLADMRSLVSSCSVHELIWRILDDTGYETFVCALPGGERRRANLMLLIRKAMDFEQGSYRGLFNFLRYISSLEKVSDAPEAVLADSGEKAVRIMTIHKSKGLEFPVVFVCGLGKKLGGSESSDQLLMHPVYGAGVDWKDSKLHVRMPGIQRQFIISAQKKEEMGEELRVLYVAMTRAKEKLILTGTVSHPDTVRRRWEERAQRSGLLLPARFRLGAGSYLDLIMPVALRGKSGLKLIELGQGELREGVREALAKEQIRQKMPAGDESETLKKLRDEIGQLAAQEAFARELEEKPGIPMTVSVSELKHPMYEEEMRQISYSLYSPESPDASEKAAGVEKAAGEEAAAGTEKAAGEETAPEEKEGMPEAPPEKVFVSAAAGGSAWHALMEHLDYLDPDIEGQLERLIKCGKIDRFAAGKIRPDAVRIFLEAPIGKRMKNAFESGKLNRETPFVIGRSAKELKAEWDSDRIVLVQGIIDAWFEEDGQIVLLDYKTDRVDPAADPDGETLVRRYALQLRIYADALASLTGEQVKEMLIYSFSLGKTIAV